ncbi:hypothetical protein [Tessaracoccus antarcticus]|uniref:DUF3618 domain-containing protein n=1 Tax=Tessaracoccus antarcticus TaxID=2479848 RepID=A0A3M0G9V1_9ACTN|nr:hypothetical protein [Tessaracoccus antarcticus]RMB61664.1 hypothetical protein EAX62_03255 [Tessaracoccus antarcticus]
MAYSDQEHTSGEFEVSGDGAGSQLGDANETWEERFGPGPDDLESETDILGDPTAGTDVDFGQAAGVAGDRIDVVAASGWETVEQRDTTSGSTTDRDRTEDLKNEATQAASDAGDRARDVAGTAQREAGAVKDAALAAGADVADSVTQQAGNVAHEVGHQSRRLMDEGVAELQTQAGAGQQRLAELSRSFGSELQAMTSATENSGPITDLANNAQVLFDDAANWLERNEPADVLDSVRRYASRNPLTFLAISAGVGFVGARIVRGLQTKERAPQPARDVPSQYYGSQTAAISPVEDPAYAGGPRYGGQDRVQPSATPGVSMEPEGGTGFESQPFTAPAPTPYGGQRGL